jgi:hypothetical protein
VAGHAKDKEFLSLYRVAGGVCRGAGQECDSQINYCTDKIIHRCLPQTFSFDSNYGVHATELSATVQADTGFAHNRHHGGCSLRQQAQGAKNKFVLTFYRFIDRGPATLKRFRR